jgi:hypothetical protein
MRKRYAKRLLAAFLCVSLIFQSASATILAAEQITQEETMKNVDTEEPSTENERMTQEGSAETDFIETDSEYKMEDSTTSEETLSVEENQETEKGQITEISETQTVSMTEDSELEELETT